MRYATCSTRGYADSTDRSVSARYGLTTTGVPIVDQSQSHLTFFIGENGAGRSTLIEAIAVAAGFNAEGGSRNFDFSTQRTDSELYDVIRLVRSPRRQRDGFFLSAETLHDAATFRRRMPDGVQEQARLRQAQARDTVFSGDQRAQPAR